MANENLLKEAIADAKAVKETAIANAKLALEEAFTPHLKSMLSAKLEEMDKDDMDEGMHDRESMYNEEMHKDDMDEGMHDRESLSNDEMDEDELENFYLDLDTMDEGEKEEVEEMDAVSFRRKNSPSYNFDPDGGPVNPVPHKVGKSTVQEEEMDLDELLAEFELDEDARTDAEEEGYLDGMRDEKEDLKEDERTDAEEEGYLDGMKDEKEDMEDDMKDEEIDLEDMSENDLKGFIEDVIKDLVADGTIEAGDEFEGEDEEIEDVEVEDEVDVDVEIDEAKEYMTKKEKSEGDDRDYDDPAEVETEKMREMKKDLYEAINTVNELKSELNEVNLLNAKLLYTNKIFKSKNLTEGKKVKVLKAFDQASTVKEAKVVFETLNEGLNSKTTKPPLNEIKGRASKPMGLAPKAKQPIIESNDVYNRMRKLAGLI